jgi:hypothetical protein
VQAVRRDIAQQDILLGAKPGFDKNVSLEPFCRRHACQAAATSGDKNFSGELRRKSKGAIARRVNT